MDQVAVTASSGRRADAVRDANIEVINFVEGCPDEQWAHRTAEEGWTLSMAGMHIATAHLSIGRMVQRAASGLDITDTLEDFEKSNASDSRYHSHMSQSAVVDRLRIYGAALERLVRDLSDEQLCSVVSFHGTPITAAELVETVAVAHARGHLAHMASA
jgi:Mycothiol maleylpyruvate isomerase N-terminal domain